MIKSAGKKLLVAVLGICVALMTVLGVATYRRDGGIVADAEGATNANDLLNFGIDCNGTSPNSFGGPLLSIKWRKPVNQPASWGARKAVIGDGTVGDYIVITTKSGESKTVTELGNKITRVISYGQETGINFEGDIKKADVKSITLKAGLAPLVKGDNADNWGGDSVIYDTDSTKALPVDVTIYPAVDRGLWEVESTALTITTQPTKVSYMVGDTFDPTGMKITATTVGAGELSPAVAKLAYSYDFTTAGEKTVTVSYAGITTTIDVTVEAPSKTVESIALKSGSKMLAKQFTKGVSFSEGAKLVVSYSDNTTEEISLTSDMVSGYSNAELGDFTATVTYEGKTCEIPYTVSAYDGTTDFQGITLGNSYSVAQGGFGVDFLVGGNGSYKYLWSIDKAASAVTGKTLGDLVTINGVTVTQLVNEGKVARIYTYGKTLGFHIDNASYKNEVLNGGVVELLPGFQFVTNSDDAFGGNASPETYTLIDGALITSPVYFCFWNGKSVKAAETVTISGSPKTVYTKDDTIDLNGLSLTVKYYGESETETVEVTADMCEYDFSEVTESTAVTVSYNGKSATFNVEVKAPVATITGIAVKDNAKLSLKQYSLNATLTEGAKLVVSYSDNTTEEVDLTLAMIGGYTNEKAGDFKATVTYKDNTCEIGYTVSAYDGTSFIKGINYGPVYGSEGTGYANFVGIDDVTAPLKALWNVDKAKSLIIGKTNGDLVTINGVTLTQLVSEGKVARMLMNGRNFGFHIDDAEFMATVKNGAEICFLPGFAWLTNSSDAWGAPTPETYEPIENAVVTSPLYFSFKNEKVNKVIDTVTLKGTPKAAYNKGDVIDVTGLSLAVKYKGFDVEYVDLTADMCEYDFASAGNKTVTVTYDGKTVTFDVTVEDVVLSEVEITSEPTKKDYDFGIENELDLTGLVVTAKYGNGTTKEISQDSLTITGFDSRKFGVQTIKVVYGEFEVTFEVEVKNISANKYLGIDYVSAATSYESTQHNSLVISFILNGVYEEVNSFWGANKLDYVADYMLINGKKVSDLVAEGKVTRLAVWASQLVIHLDTTKLVPATWVDKRADKNDPNDKGIHYIEGESEVVETVTFLPGFQWYTVNGVLSGDLWGNDNAYQYATPIAGAVLKETITIHNEDGYGWTRPLKKDGDKVASDALTIASLPKKTTYAPGEKLELTGLQILAKYEDGGEEIIVPGASEVDGFKKDTEGTQTLSYTYFGQTVSFEITVKNPDSGKTGGCGSALDAAGLSGLAMLGLAFIAKRKRK